MVVEFEVPGTSVYLPDLRDFGIQPDEELGALLLVLAPLLFGVLVLIIAILARHKRSKSK